MKKSLVAVAAFLLILTARTEESADRWHVTAGPAWRATMKSSISGGMVVPAATASHAVSYDKSVAGHGAWSVDETVCVPDPETPGYDLYAAAVTRTETTVSPGRSHVPLGSEDWNSPLGLKTSACYDFYAGERFSVGLNLVFAAYWNMRTSATGVGGGGSRRIQTSRDYYLFENGPYPDDADFSYASPSTSPYAPYHQELGDATESFPLQAFSARIRSDLYQMGLGPKAVWHALERLDVYADVEALCNIAALDFDCGTTDASETLCRAGVGANVGSVVRLTDWLGLYAEVGYEWVDKAEADVKGAQTEVDFSSLVVSAGLCASF